MTESISWSPSKKVLFRFFAIYVLLYSTANHFIFNFGKESIWSGLIAWFSRNILSYETDSGISRGRSGDTSSDAVLLLIFICISFTVTIVWSILDRRRENYTLLFNWMVVFVRYYLVYEMFIYGLTKIFLVQFGELQVYTLEQNVGDQSPMGLVWNFMAYSPGYTMLTGWVEFMGGIFLLFRRTQTLGAMIIFTVMANVVALNFFYDIPVKLLSSHIFLLAFFLVCLDARRLWNVLVLNRTAEPISIRILIRNRKLIILKNLLKWSALIILTWIYISLLLRLNRSEKLYSRSFYGTYKVQQFTRSPKSESSKKDWKSAEIAMRNYANVRYSDDSVEGMNIRIYPLGKFITIRKTHENNKDTLRIYSHKNNITILKGVLDADTVNIHLRKRQKSDFPLMNYKFQWIQQFEDQH